nr:MAG TPA: hypothetical protein [Caudoviricetes sp.]
MGFFLSHNVLKSSSYTQLPRSHPARCTAHLSTSCGTAFFLAADK